LTTYCPVPGPVPTSPANRDYQAGFTAAMMLKDLKLAHDAARDEVRLAARGGRERDLPALCRRRRRQHGFFRHHPVPGRQVKVNGARRCGAEKKTRTQCGARATHCQ